MATLTKTGSPSIGTGTLSATFTYTVTSDDTGVWVNASQISWEKPSVSYGVSAVVTFDGKTVTDFGNQTASGSRASAAKIKAEKTTTARTAVLSIELFEVNNYQGYVSRTSKGTATANISVPALSSHSVIYNANGHGTAPATQTKYNGINITLASAITATGFSFIRWNTNGFNTGTGYNAGATYSVNSTSNVTLYAIWNRTVTYNANGGSNPPAAQTELATSAITITSSLPTRSGYRFKNWNTAANGTGTTYSSGSSYASGLASTMLYAQWEKIISSVNIGSATVIRTEDDVETDEADEGTYAYISIPYTVTGMAAANIEMSVTATADTGTAPTVTLVSWQATKPEDVSQNGTFIARASGCELDSKYSFTITIAANNTSVSQAAVTAIRTAILPTAFFLVDFKAGGKGVHFGGSATEDGFFVSMPATFNDEVTLSRESFALFHVKRPDLNNYHVAFGIGSSGNYGIYDYNYSKYIIWGDRTGNVYIPGHRSTGSIVIQNGYSLQINGTIPYTVGTTRSTNTYSGAIYSYDSNGDRIYYSELAATTTGTVYRSYVITAKNSGGTTYYSGFYTGINADGTAYFSLTGTNMAASMRSAIGAVNKAGDTMTGGLIVSYATPTIIAKATNINAALSNNNVSSTTWWGHPCQDSAGRITAQFLAEAVSDGKTAVGMWVYNFNTSGTSVGTAGFRMYMDKSGNVSYSIPNQTAFRNALGASSGVWTAAMIPSLDASKIGSGTLGIARGGTGTTTGIKGWTQIAQVQGTNSASYTNWSTSGYTEIMLMIWYSTSYLGTAVWPTSSIGGTQYEIYTGGGRSGTGTGQRKACAKVSNVKLTGVQCAVDGTDVTASSYFRLYAR